MPATNGSQVPEVQHEPSTPKSVRLMRAATAPALARRFVEGQLAVPLRASRARDIALLTSEVVTNVVQHSSAGPIEISVVATLTFTRVEVGNPGERWIRRPAPRSADLDEVGGWGLFLVEQLSDRWGMRDEDRTVWFEFDHPNQRSVSLLR